MVDPYQFGYSTLENVKKALTKLHHEKEMGQQEIADHYRLSRHTIIRAFNQLGVEVSNSDLIFKKAGFKTEEEFISELNKLYYEKDKTIEQIAEHFAVNYNSIRRYMVKNKIVSKDKIGSVGTLLRITEFSEKDDNLIIALMLSGASIKVNNGLAVILIKVKPAIGKYIIEEYPNFGFKYDDNLVSEPFQYLVQFYKKWKNKTIPADIILNKDICYWWYLLRGSLDSSIKIYMRSMRGIKQLVGKIPVESHYYETIVNKSKRPIISTNKHFLEYIGPCRHKLFSKKWLN